MGRAEAIDQTFLGIMVRGWGQLTAYFYSQQRPFHPEPWRDNTFRLKQKETHRLSATCTCCEKRAVNHFEVIMFGRTTYALNLHFNSLSVSLSRPTLPSYDIKYLCVVLMAMQILSAVFLPINYCISLAPPKNVKIKYLLVLVVI